MGDLDEELKKWGRVQKGRTRGEKAKKLSSTDDESLYSLFLLSSNAWEGTGFLECDFYPEIHEDL